MKKCEIWDRTRAKKILKISEQFGPIDPQAWPALDPYSKSELHIQPKTFSGLVVLLVVAPKTFSGLVVF